ncbi:unnamed protein product, partial [Laminaria digitata]
SFPRVSAACSALLCLFLCRFGCNCHDDTTCAGSDVTATTTPTDTCAGSVVSATTTTPLCAGSDVTATTTTPLVPVRVDVTATRRQFSASVTPRLAVWVCDTDRGPRAVVRH